jgi:calcium-activated chloride channel regulator 4
MKTNKNFIAGKSTRFPKLFLLSFVAFLFVANFAKAKVHWFSGRVVNDKTIPSSSITNIDKIDANAPETIRHLTASPALVPVPGTVLVDVIVSLYNDPCGDDDGSTQGNPGSEKQDTYEKIFQYFADGVYESTEGTHKLRNIRIYTNGKYASRANLQWHAKGHPHVPYKGGVNVTGGHINMYDIFEDGEGAGHDHDMLADLDGAGYTCAHEWGHYYYGLYDEYLLQAGDKPVVPAIMNRQWDARGGHYNWLNFSIAWDGLSNPAGPYQNTRITKQHRVFGKSAWETLSSNTTNDDANKMSLGPRTYYSELATVAPAGANTPAIQLPGTARSDVNIIWMGDANLVYQIVIDQSGSMSGIVENAKIAAKLLVDKAEVNETKLGVIMFDDVVTVLQPIIPINSQATKDAIKGIIDTITADGMTAIGAAANAALNGLLATGSTKDTKMVFLLSDGESTVPGDDPLSVIPAYQAAQIPIYTFAYGTYADTATLGAMADETGGQLYLSPTTLAEVTQVFDDAFLQASDSQGVGIGSQTVNRRTETFPLQVDSTLGRLDLIVTYTGSLADVDVHLYNPSDIEVAADSNTESGGQTLYQYSVENPEMGQWELDASSNAGAIMDFSYRASGLPEDVTYSLSVDSSAGTSVTYPATVVLTATMEKGLPIAGADVFAQVEDPCGSITPFTLRDDGVTPDSLAKDGKYTGNLIYRQNGLHKISIQMDNYSGKAVLTYNGAIMSADVNGNLPKQIKDKLVREDFSRSASLQVTTAGYTPPPDSNITIDKCNINAGKGKKVEMDSITCSGRFVDPNGIEENDINSASEVYVKIYDACNPTGYSGTIAFDPTRGKKGKYHCQYRIPKGGPGAITAFNLDLIKQTFSLQAKNICLGGLSCPLFIKIEIGDYVGVGQAGEDIVNGSRVLIPTTLMNGYADTLKVGKWTVKQGRTGKGDSLTVMGSIASLLPVPTEFSGDPLYHIGSCTLTWGLRNFVFDLQFHYDRYYGRTHKGPIYETAKGGATADTNEIVKVKIDFEKGTFTAQIKGATPDCSLAVPVPTVPVTFGIAFDTYTATDYAYKP